MAAEWGRSKEALCNCIRLSAKADPAASSHNDFELLLLEARYRSSLEYSALLQDIVPCVECPTASPAHRVRAAVMALKIATDLGPGELIDSLYGHVAPLLDCEDVPERGRLEVDIVYRTLRGSDVLPVSELRRFVNSANKADGLEYLNALLTAASACRMSGRYNEGMEFVSEAADHARSHKLTNRLDQVFLGAVRLHIAVGELGKADLALQEVEKYATSSDDPHVEEEPPVLATRIAIENGDLSRASAAFAKIEHLPSNYSASRRAYQSALAIHIRLMQGASSDLIEPFVTKLEEALAFIQGIGVKDFESFALYLGLRAVGRREKATKLLREYVLTHRRSRWPLSEQMQAALRSPDASEYHVGDETLTQSEP